MTRVLMLKFVSSSHTKYIRARRADRGTHLNFACGRNCIQASRRVAHFIVMICHYLLRSPSANKKKWPQVREHLSPAGIQIPRSRNLCSSFSISRAREFFVGRLIGCFFLSALSAEQTRSSFRRFYKCNETGIDDSQITLTSRATRECLPSGMNFSRAQLLLISCIVPPTRLRTAPPIAAVILIAIKRTPPRLNKQKISHHSQISF
jgi:hypothetical protein